MSYRISPMDRGASLCQAPSAWRRSELPRSVGTCFTDSLIFDDGLAVIYSNFEPHHDLVEAGSFEGEPTLTVAIALSGRSSSTGKNGHRHDFICGQSTIAFYSSLQGERRYPGEQAIRQLRLIAKPALLQRYGLEHLIGQDTKDLSALPLFSGKYGVATQRLAGSLLHLHDHGGGLLDTHIAALGLLSEQVRPLAPPTQATHNKVNSKDQDLMLKARDILITQFDQKLTIAYLCASLGTNEFKLKQNFRHVFGTSPYRMLTDIRMAKAWELLEQGKHVSTVAYQVGFQHLSSFSAAFEKYFGRSPNSVRGAKQADTSTFAH